MDFPAVSTAEASCDDSSDKALDAAIGRIVGMQRSDGSFGVWSDSDDTVPWLDAYATDFLLRAKEHGKAVPEEAAAGVRPLAPRLELEPCLEGRVEDPGMRRREIRSDGIKL